MFILFVMLPLLKVELRKMVTLYLSTLFPLIQYEYTPVGAAAGRGHTDLVQKLLLHGFEVDGRAMVIHVHVIVYSIKEGLPALSV